MDEPEPAPRATAARRVAHAAAAAVRRPFNPWFLLLNKSVIEESATTRDTVAEQLQSLEHDVVGRLERSSGEVLDSVRSETDTLLEMALAVERTAARSEEALLELRDRMANLETHLGIPVRLGTDDLNGFLRLVGRPLAELPGPAAHLINWANGAIGLAGESGYFVNHAVFTLFDEGGVHLEDVNERIVEVPWAHHCAWELPIGSRVLDVGGAESLLSLELASRGHHVTVLEPRGYNFPHPNLSIAAVGAEEWEGPAEPFDAIFCISTIEHLGLGHYVDPSPIDELDRVVIQRFRDWLRPGGELLLSVPCGQWSVDTLQRIYDQRHLDALLAGWKSTEEHYFRVQDRAWVPTPAATLAGGWPDERHGVAMFRLVPE